MIFFIKKNWFDYLIYLSLSWRPAKDDKQRPVPSLTILLCTSLCRWAQPGCGKTVVPWIDEISIYLKIVLRREVRANFNIRGTRYFKDAVFHKKSKKIDVLSLLYLWLAKRFVCRGQVFLDNQRYRRLKTKYFFDFWWKTAS